MIFPKLPVLVGYLSVPKGGYHYCGWFRNPTNLLGHTNPVNHEIFLISTRSRRISTVVFCRKKKYLKNHLTKFLASTFFSPSKRGILPTIPPHRRKPPRLAALQAMDSSDLALVLALASDLPDLGVFRQGSPTDRPVKGRERP